MPDFVALWTDSGADGALLCALGKGFCVRAGMASQPQERQQVEDFLPAAAVEVLRAGQISGQGTLLLLEDSLPPPWLDVAWESMTVSGKELGRTTIVVRLARPGFGPLRSDARMPARWLNLFPPHEFDFRRGLEEFVGGGSLRPTNRESYANDIAGAADLFVLAHANELGLEDQQGRPWALPEASVLPERVWLLACNRSGAMDAVAGYLLKRGAGCVVSATGDLSAPEMLTAIRKWLAADRVDDVASWLLANRPLNAAAGGAASLRIWGHVCVDRSASWVLNRATWAMEHGRDLRPPLNDDTSAEEYFSMVEAYRDQRTWARTRAWMASRLLWLAERYDHPSIPTFERQMAQPRSARDHEALSSAARRFGHYPHAARYLASGLRLARLSEGDKAVLLANLTNLLIDLDLPRSALVAEVAFEDCIPDDVRTRQENDFKRLDFLARIAARDGQIEIALDRMQEKRALAAATGDDRREVAGLLYLAAWAKLNDAVDSHLCSEWAGSAVDSISSMMPADVGEGNETIAYLIRALAAFYWVSEERSVLPILRRWEAFAEERLRADDSGPWSYILIFLHLANEASRLSFDRAMESLARSRYFLESAMFFLLAGRRDDYLRAIARFHKRRQQTIDALQDVGADFGIDAKAEALARGDIERHSLKVPMDLVRAGAMPL